MGAKPVPIQIPIGREGGFRGSVDLIQQKAILFDDETLGAKYVVEDIPPDLQAQADEYRELMLESVAEFDEAVLEKYLGGEPLSEEEIKSAVRKGTLLKKITPVLCGAAFKNKGVQLLLDAVIDFLPSPLDVPPVVGVNPKSDEEVQRHAKEDDHFSALAFKIMSDPFVGQLTYFRVYSGTLKAGSYVYNSIKEKKERIGRLLKMHANKREEITEVSAGDIAASVGLKNTATGDTLCEEGHPVVLEVIRFPEPVISMAIEPKTKPDQEKLGLSLQKLSQEDPSLFESIRMKKLARRSFQGWENFI